jgi:hypothetical protein
MNSKNGVSTASKGLTKGTDNMGEYVPLNMKGMNILGEPDPANITKQDILQSIAFDKKGDLLSVGDKGGRIIVF